MNALLPEGSVQPLRGEDHGLFGLIDGVIRHRCLLRMNYEMYPRIVEPHALKQDPEGRPWLLAWQVVGASESEAVAGWKQFRLDDILDATALCEEFDAERHAPCGALGGPATTAAGPWRILVVDDDPEIHAVTRRALDGFSFRKRAVRVVEAANAAEAQELLLVTPNVALILLGVNVPSRHVGLDFVTYVREDLQNHGVRIALRTPAAALAPPQAMVERYEIDDYRAKPERTGERLLEIAKSALRAYEKYRLLASRDGPPENGFAGR